MSRNPASSPRRASSPAQGSAGAGVLKKIATAIGAVLVALVIAAIALFWFIGDHTDFGRERVVWKTQTCGGGLVTVTSCSFEQTPRSNPGTGADRTPNNGWDNTFTMTLADGTKRATVITTDDADDIASRGGLTGVLYEACASRSGSASMTMEVYPHTWSIVDARID